MVTKQSVIMHRSYAVNSAPDREFFWEWPDGRPGVARQITLVRSDWEDMGSPKVITVTIEPGDLLNDDAP